MNMHDSLKLMCSRENSFSLQKAHSCVYLFILFVEELEGE